MNFESVIKRRRMCREYLDRDVPQEKVNRILDHAPLALLSRRHSTALPSPKRYDNRYEGKVLINIDLHQLLTSPWGGTEDVEVRDKSLLTSFSIDGEYNLNSF
jgi:nitroreductase